MDARTSDAKPAYLAGPRGNSHLPVPPGFRNLGFAKEIHGVLQELGTDADRILAEAGIQRQFFDNADNLLSVKVLGQLLLHCVERTSCPHFGILVGQKATLDSLRLLGAVMRACDTLENALLTLERYHRILDRGAVMELEVDDGVAVVSYSPYEPGGQGAGLIAEAALAATTHVLRDLCGPEWALSEVLVPRRAPKDSQPYRTCFSADVRFNQEIAALVFPASWLQTPLPGADQDARRAVELCVLQLEQACPSDFADDVRRLLRTRLLKKRCVAAEAAQRFSMHRRTLSRHLKAAGTGFRAVSDEMKFEVARQLMADTDMQFAEISAVLDFSEPAAFTRAFERWSGVTPSVWRSLNVPRSYSSPLLR